ncbi:2-hydroxychromene-2-carboxylate isomerase [Zoogloea sp. LCSB751]|uniref:2-hydroxychromene-2-carboxylate isomerase n=1 Tax=Zoogloea sp. LCSB751 TaxID=1965277 RepID=UPI0009A50448|nr:DsbA family protein [Zoogloea sp. LCSB751]
MNVHDNRVVDAFIDLRSPYSYLSLGPARQLAERTGVRFDWWPYITDFRSAYGGEVEERSQRHAAKVKYLYMDCRRLARKQGLTIRPTTKLWDSTLGCQTMLFAKSCNRLWAFIDPMLAAFWRREFDLESHAEIEAALQAAGLDVLAWRAYLATDAQAELAAAHTKAEGLGVFGAPTFVYRGELFWGSDRIDQLAETLRSPS